MCVRKCRSGFISRVLWQALPCCCRCAALGDGRQAHLCLSDRACVGVQAKRHGLPTGPGCPNDPAGADLERIVNEVKGVNRVVLDITSKPPGTNRVGMGNLPPEAPRSPLVSPGSFDTIGQPA